MKPTPQQALQYALKSAETRYVQCAVLRETGLARMVESNIAALDIALEVFKVLEEIEPYLHPTKGRYSPHVHERIVETIAWVTERIEVINKETK